MKANKDLIKYFSKFCFFADSSIEDLKFNPILDTISFNINCPNIKFREDGELDLCKYEYVNVDFNCYFFDVVYFNIESEFKQDDYDYERREIWPISFEINTLVDIIHKYEKGNDCDVNLDEYYNSLVIKTDLGKTISIVFDGLTVSAVEESAFTLMRHDKRYTIPYCE